MSKATAILTADWHLMERTPVCRTDDFQSAMWKKVDFVIGLAYKYNCPIFNAGDFFDRWKVSTHFITKCYSHLYHKTIHTVYGQHDLPNHNLDRIDESALCCLAHCLPYQIIQPGNDTRVKYVDWNETEDEPIEGQDILVTHQMTYPRREIPYPGCKADNARKLMKKHSWAKLIVTGDNHNPFTVKFNNQLLVNPGSLMRIKADQIDHKPRVYLYYEDTNSVEPIYLPIEDNVIDRSHIDTKKKRDDRIEAYVSKLKTDYDVSLSFRDNVEAFFQENKVNDKVKEIIWEALDG